MKAGALILVLGGARSGKSDYATRLAAHGDDPVTLVATAEPLDAEMARRIDLHRRSRPKHWTTIEAPMNVAEALSAAADRSTVVLDDLGLLVANHGAALAAGRDDVAETIPDDLERLLDDRIANELRGLSDLLSGNAVRAAIVVSNEVGMGVVPPTSLGRLFRDALGRANQTLAAEADSVVLCVAGLPTILKGVDPMKDGAG